MPDKEPAEVPPAGERVEGQQPERNDDIEAGACWICGAAVDERHCKIVCPRCGFTRDCSDP